MSVMTQDDVCGRIKVMLVDSLALEDGSGITPETTLRGDLGIESIDFLDILFRMSAIVGKKIPDDELIPVEMQPSGFQLHDNKMSVKRFEALRSAMPYADFTGVQAKDGFVSVLDIANTYTVGTLLRYAKWKQEH